MPRRPAAAPSCRAAGALRGRTLEKLCRSPAGDTATAASPARTPPAVGESRGGGLRQRSGRGPQQGAFHSNYEGGVGPGAAERAAASPPARRQARIRCRGSAAEADPPSATPGLAVPLRPSGRDPGRWWGGKGATRDTERDAQSHRLKDTGGREEAGMGHRPREGRKREERGVRG